MAASLAIPRHMAGARIPWIDRDWIRPVNTCDRTIAAHEAGHVIAAITLGYRTFAATIRPNDKREGLTQIIKTDRLWARPRDNAVIYIAGPLAQNMRFGTPIMQSAGSANDASSDMVAFQVAIRQLARKHGGSEIIQTCMEKICIRKAETLLIQNLHQLVELEMALFERVELDESEIADILRNAR